MKKLVLSGLVFLAVGMSLFAGDAAAFVDLGISGDGRTYAFGEYGKTDKSFQGYAEIYTVDIAKNDFVDGAVFKTPASSATGSKSGKAVFDELFDKASWKLRPYDFKPAEVDNLLYVRDDKKAGESEIVFKDFEGSTVEQSVFYHIKLVKTCEGSGENLRSSFFITLEKKNGDGDVISRNIVGSPDIKRKKVTDYRIDRIFSDKSGRNLVFVVEKTLSDVNGSSIRYMVETIRL
jgi:predicted secreted protein